MLAFHSFGIIFLCALVTIGRQLSNLWQTWYGEKQLKTFLNQYATCNFCFMAIIFVVCILQIPFRMGYHYTTAFSLQIFSKGSFHLQLSRSSIVNKTSLWIHHFDGRFLLLVFYPAFFQADESKRWLTFHLISKIVWSTHNLTYSLSIIYWAYSSKT